MGIPPRGPHPLLGRGLKDGVSCPKIDESVSLFLRFTIELVLGLKLPSDKLSVDQRFRWMTTKNVFEISTNEIKNLLRVSKA